MYYECRQPQTTHAKTFSCLQSSNLRLTLHGTKPRRENLRISIGVYKLRKFFRHAIFTSTTVGKSKNIKEQNDQSYFLHRCFNYFGLYQSRWVNNYVYVYITNNFSIYLIFHNRSIEVLLFSSAYHKVLFNMSFKFALKCALTISKLPKNCYKKHYSP